MYRYEEAARIAEEVAAAAQAITRTHMRINLTHTRTCPCAYRTYQAALDEAARIAEEVARVAEETALAAERVILILFFSPILDIYQESFCLSFVMLSRPWRRQLQKQRGNILFLFHVSLQGEKKQRS